MRKKRKTNVSLFGAALLLALNVELRLLEPDVLALNVLLLGVLVLLSVPNVSLLRKQKLKILNLYAKKY